jgi:hypothetical protein
MVNGYLTDGDVAPQIIFHNGPAACPYCTARDDLYNWGYTPTYQVDGVFQQIGWSQSVVEGFIDTRIAVPSYVQIDVDIVGDASGGTAYYTVTVEQDPGVSGEVRIWSAILESHDIATSAYGVYAGQELMWEPRAWPMGATGTVISIAGPYPQTINVSGPYTLDPVQHTFDNLDVITYVQASTGNHEVVNAAFMDLPDTAVGIGDVTGAEMGTASLDTWPNPSGGMVSIASVIPGDATGQVRVYDVLGRTVGEFTAGGISTITLDEPGVYFARLETSSGVVVSTRFTVVR